MALGYAIVTIILIALVVYLVLKSRNLHAQLHTLESLEADEARESVHSGTAARDVPAAAQTPAAHPH
jgi:hypothetical protein